MPVDPRKFLEPAEVRRLRAAAADLGGRSRVLVELLLGTGMRIGEAVILERRDYLPDLPAVAVPRLKKRNGKRPRDPVPISRELSVILGEWMADQPGKPTDPVFGEVRQTLFRDIKRAMAAAGLDKAPHALRHTYAQAMLDSGVNVKILSKLLGHSSVAVTLDLYCVARWEDKVAAVSRLYA